MKICRIYHKEGTEFFHAKGNGVRQRWELFFQTEEATN